MAAAAAEDDEVDVATLEDDEDVVEVVVGAAALVEEEVGADDDDDDEGLTLDEDVALTAAAEDDVVAPIFDELAVGAEDEEGLILQLTARRWTLPGACPRARSSNCFISRLMASVLSDVGKPLAGRTMGDLRC